MGDKKEDKQKIKKDHLLDFLLILTILTDPGDR